MSELLTDRLHLRQWRLADLEPFAALNADPLAMAFMPSCLSREASDRLARGAEAEIGRRGWGLWAVELLETQELIGCIGLAEPSFEAHFTPCVEVLWRLRPASWGCGYASEGARECLRFAFESLGLPEIVSFTVPANTRSRAVMERLGMRYNPEDDFDHPRLAVGHPLRRHVLYLLGREAWFQPVCERTSASWA
jgi:RimJ/RimL family protein N-acetyltransferase